MTPQQFDDLQRKYVSRTPHMLAAGMAVTALSPGRGSMSMPARPDCVGDPVRGLLHPGALTVLADSACGLAVGAAMAQRAMYATLDLRMDYLRPAGPGADLHCDAHCYRLTRSIGFVRAEVWQQQADQPIAAAQASFMLGTPAGQGRGAPPAGAGQAAAPTPSASDAGAQGIPANTARNDAPGQPWVAPEASLPALAPDASPYVHYLGIRMAPAASDVPGDPAPLYRLPYQPHLIGNPYLPALHGGVIAGFAETAAMLHLIHTLQGSKWPKGVDFSIDYLRVGRPEETFAACELVRLGSRVALVQVRCWQRSPEQPIAVARGHFLLAALNGG